MLTPEQLSELKDSLRSELADAIRSAVAEAMKPYRDRASAAAYLSVGVDFIDLKKRQGKLKPIYVGSKPLYPVEQLNQLPTRKKT